MSNYMGLEVLQHQIKEKGSFTLAEGTHLLSDLLPIAYDMICTYNLEPYCDCFDRLSGILDMVDEMVAVLEISYEDVLDYPEKVFRQGLAYDFMETVSWLWREELFHFFNKIAPEGFYFDAHKDDGSCFGWWKIDEGLA